MKVYDEKVNEKHVLPVADIGWTLSRLESEFDQGDWKGNECEAA